MEKKALIDLLNSPAEITKEQTRELEILLEKAPYFQAGRAIRLKGLKEHQEFSYNSALKKTAAYTTDRDILFDFITSEEFNQNTIARQIRQQEDRLKEMTVYEHEEVHGRRSIDLDDAIKMKQSESERVMDPALFERAQLKDNSSDVEFARGSSEEENLEIGKPLEFDQKESHSFSEWLKLTKAEPVERENQPEETENEDRQRKFDLIEEFIAKNPKIKPVKSVSKNNLAEDSMTSQESLMTETLARVYLEQKNYKKAIQAYKILILKNPEKSGFFADQIRAIEKLQDTNND
jgi:tetratricopeptide (TPR) repeat protein